MRYFGDLAQNLLELVTCEAYKYTKKTMKYKLTGQTPTAAKML